MSPIDSLRESNSKVMKKVFLVILSLFFLQSTSTIAQRRERVTQLPNYDKKLISFAYYLGFNKKGFKIRYNDSPSTMNATENLITVEETTGFNIGLVVNLRLHKNIDLRFEPGLSSNTKRLTFNNQPMIPDTDNAKIRDVPATYLRMPLVFKFSTDRLDNMKAFVLGGASYDYNFSSNQKNSKDNADGQFRMKTHNFMYELGLGVDLYLPYFKFSPSIRGIFAMNNEIVLDNNGLASPWTGPIDYFGTRGIFINFTFQ